MAALSTYMWVSRTSGNSVATPPTTSRQKTLVASTLALSTEVTWLRRPRASAKAARAMRSISKRR